MNKKGHTLVEDKPSGAAAVHSAVPVEPGARAGPHHPAAQVLRIHARPCHRIHPRQNHQPQKVQPLSKYKL